jgi:arylsulfatase A-like enzyme
MNNATRGNNPKTSSAWLKQTCAIGMMFWLGASAASAIAAPAARPNIVFILADDLGYGSVGCYGASPQVVKTPHIDRLAREGMRFTQAYTPGSWCTPTRYALMTGRYFWRRNNPRHLIVPLLIETTRPTLASLLQQAGYATAVVGKWDLGFGTKPREFTDLSSPLSPGPRQVGFDYFFGIPHNHGEHWGVYAENEAVWGLRSTNHVEPPPGWCKKMGFDAPQRDDWTAQTVLTDRAVAWLKQQSPAKPFFLYFASAAIHVPITPTKDARGTSGAGIYGDWIHDVDISVGCILKALDEVGVMENTLVIFTSDNGAHQFEKPAKHAPTPPPYTNLVDAVWEAQQKGLKPNGILRGQKCGIHEGGFRVPFVARWPGHIPAKSESGQMICLVDMLATTAALLDVPLPKPEVAAEDSCSFLPALLGQTAAKPGRDTLVLQNLVVFPKHIGGVFAVRKGRWKWIEGIATGPGKADEALYDLASDPAEKHNVIQAHPDVVKELRAALNAIRNRGHSRAE